MKIVEIVCPNCGKIITKVSEDSNAVIYGYCRRCKTEQKIEYQGRAKKEPLKK